MKYECFLPVVWYSAFLRKYSTSETTSPPNDSGAGALGFEFRKVMERAARLNALA